jgi:hypothetical protein
VDDPTMPRPGDVLINMHTGEVAFTHEDFVGPQPDFRKQK